MGFEDMIRQIIREELQTALAGKQSQLPAVLTAKQAAEILGVSRSFLYELSNQKDFPVFNVGRHKKIPRDQFLTWVANSPYRNRKEQYQ